MMAEARLVWPGPEVTDPALQPPLFAYEDAIRAQYPALESMSWYGDETYVFHGVPPDQQTEVLQYAQGLAAMGLT